MVNKYVFAGVNSLVRIKPSEVAMFDWYAPKVASHHTDVEMRKWFKENNVVLLYTDNPRVNPASFHNKMYPRFTKNKNGNVKNFYYKLIPRWGISMSGVKENA